MMGFKDWFTEKHGFWPATQHELVSDVLSRLCNEVAEFIDSATGRGDYAEIEVKKPPRTETMKIYHSDDKEYRAYHKSRFPFIGSGHEPFQYAGHMWRYEFTSFDDQGKYDVILRFLDVPPAAPEAGKPINLSYRNYRGEVSIRTITPLKPWYGSTEWHPEPQWLLKAFDHEKDAERDFALADFGTHTLAVKLELIRSVSETPVPSHGGPASIVAWELHLNSVCIQRFDDRVRWDDRQKCHVEPPLSLQVIYDTLKGALGPSSPSIDATALQHKAGKNNHAE